MRKAFKISGWVSVAIFCVLLGAFLIRLTDMLVEDAEFRRIRKIRDKPPGPEMASDANSCAIFAAVARDHYRARNMPVRGLSYTFPTIWTDRPPGFQARFLKYPFLGEDEFSRRRLDRAAEPISNQLRFARLRPYTMAAIRVGRS